MATLNGQTVFSRQQEIADLSETQVNELKIWIGGTFAASLAAEIITALNTGISDEDIAKIAQAVADKVTNTVVIR